MSTLGVAAYRYVFRPLNALGYGNLVRQGPTDTVRAHWGRRGLRRWVDRQLSAAEGPSRPPLAASAQRPDLSVAYLAGDSQRDLLFASLTSLYRHWPQPPAIRLFSDGALSAPLAAAFERAFPGLVTIRGDEQREQLEFCFPRSRFPVLRGVRDQYLHLRKMLDVFSRPSGWVLLLDADTLFVAEPTELIAQLSAGSRALFLLDRHDDAYGYTHEVLQSLIQAPLLHRINAGLLVLPSQAIDWERVEHWLAVLSADHGLNYFVEQALWALILSSIGAESLPQSDYICDPNRVQILSRSGVFHHYVWPCRYLFYGHGWQRLACG